LSLINRMLRDLSSRQPAAGNVMSGIQVQGAAAPARSNPLGKIGALLALVVVFTTGLWFVFGPKSVKVPQPRQAPPGAMVVTEPALEPPAPAPAPPTESADVAPATEAAPSQDTQVATAPPSVEPAAPKPRKKARKPAADTAETQPKVPATDPARAATLYADARRALDRGDERAAEPLLADALALDPKLHGAREQLGNLRVRQGRLDEAQSTVREGLALDPDWVGYRRLAARLELVRGQPAAAIELLQRDPPAIENDPEYHALMASAYQRMGRHEEAARGYQALAREQPYQAAWWAGYGLSRDALGDAAAALAAYARARQLGDLDARVLEHINQRTLALQQQPAG